MTPAQLKAIRAQLGLGVVEFGRALGLKGRANTLSVRVRAWEGGRRPIPITTAGRARALVGIR